MKDAQKLTVTISPLSFVYLVVVIAFLVLLWYSSGVVIIVLASLIFAAGLNPSVKKLEKIKFPRWLAVSVIFALTFAVLGYLIFLIAPTLVQQVNDIVANYPSISANINASLANQPLLQDLLDKLLVSIRSRPEVVTGQIGQAATGLIGGVFGFITFLVLTFYFLLSGQKISSAMVRYIPSKKRQREITMIGQESSIKLGHWIRSQLVMATIVFLATYGILTAMGVQYSLALSLFAGILQFIPFVGPLVGAIPGLLAALVLSPVSALIFIVFVIVSQLILANIVAPQLFNKAIGVSPVVILLAVLIGFSLLGPIGVILAIPVAAVVDVVFDSIGSDYVKEKISEATNS